MTERLSDHSIATVPSVGAQEAAQAQLDEQGPGWVLTTAVKGNFTATRCKYVLGASETQSSATLDGLVQAVALREEQLAQSRVVPAPEHGGPEYDD